MLNWNKQNLTEAQLDAIQKEYDEDPTGTILYLKGVSENRRLYLMQVPNSGNASVIRKLNQNGQVR